MATKIQQGPRRKVKTQTLRPEQRTKPAPQLERPPNPKRTASPPAATPPASDSE